MKYSVQQGIKGLLFNKGMSLLSIVSVGSSLIILGLVLGTIFNINFFIEATKDEINEIRISLNSSIDENTRKEIKKQIQKLEQVETLRYKSKEKAFDEMKKSWKEDAYLLEGLENPLNDYYIATIKESENAKEVSDIIKEIKGVEKVDYHQDIMENFLSISNAIKQFGSLIMLFLFVICLVLISNTIKSRVYSKREEIQIIKCFGGSNLFIISPFVVEGFLIGALGSLLSVVSCFYIYKYLSQHLNLLLDSMSSEFLIPLSELSFYVMPILFLSGILVGVLGSIISVRKYLKV